jgi:hypothetical protein
MPGAECVSTSGLFLLSCVIEVKSGGTIEKGNKKEMQFLPGVNYCCAAPKRAYVRRS